MHLGNGIAAWPKSTMECYATTNGQLTIICLTRQFEKYGVAVRAHVQPNTPTKNFALFSVLVLVCLGFDKWTIIVPNFMAHTHNTMAKAYKE